MIRQDLYIYENEGISRNIVSSILKKDDILTRLLEHT